MPPQKAHEAGSSRRSGEFVNVREQSNFVELSPLDQQITDYELVLEMLDSELLATIIQEPRRGESTFPSCSSSLESTDTSVQAAAEQQ